MSRLQETNKFQFLFPYPKEGILYDNEHKVLRVALNEVWWEIVDIFKSCRNKASRRQDHGAELLCFLFITGNHISILPLGLVEGRAKPVYSVSPKMWPQPS